MYAYDALCISTMSHIHALGHGKSADWWALGCLIMEMLTGKTPFDAPNRKEVQQRIMSGPLRFPKWMKHEAKSIVKEVRA